MTHVDENVARHIKQMLRRAMRKPTQSQEQLTKPDTLSQVVRTFRESLGYPYDLLRVTHSTWLDKG
jgi:hypothetical protein